MSDLPKVHYFWRTDMLRLTFLKSSSNIAIRCTYVPVFLELYSYLEQAVNDYIRRSLGKDHKQKGGVL